MIISHHLLIVDYLFHVQLLLILCHDYFSMLADYFNHELIFGAIAYFNLLDLFVLLLLQPPDFHCSCK